MDLGIPGLERPVEIGRGGFGVVYRARQPEFGRNVAVKVLTISRLDADGKRRFRRELRAMGALSGHPNIVTVHSAGFTASGTPYLVMGLEAGGSLADRIRASGPLPWEEAVAIGVKLAGALETAHRAGVLHRDVKPENVLLSESGEPKLADFGIARVQGGSATRTGALVATIPHAAPELIAGDPPSVASDVYALGSTVFTLIRGTPPFVLASDEGPLPMIARIGSDPVPDLRPLRVPGAVCSVLERAMAKQPADRQCSAEEFGTRLAVVTGELGRAVVVPVIVGKVRLPAAADVPDGGDGPLQEAAARVPARPPSAGSVGPARGSSDEGRLVAPAIEKTAVTTLVTDETRQIEAVVASPPTAPKKWRPSLGWSSRNSSLLAATLALLLIVPVLAVALARHGSTDARLRIASAHKATSTHSSAATTVPSPVSTATPTVAPPPPAPPPPTDPSAPARAPDGAPAPNAVASAPPPAAAPAAAGCTTGSVTASGSTALLPLAEKASQDYQAKCAGSAITVSGGGSSAGLSNVNMGASDIGLSDVPASVAPGNNIANFQDHEVAIAIFTVVANVGAGVSNLTTQQTQDIFSGRLTNWSQVGGNNVDIVLIERRPGFATRYVFDKCVMNGQPESPTPAASEESTQLVMQAVSTQAGAASYVSTAAAAGASNVVELKLDGATPDGPGVSSGGYNFFSHEHMYTRRSPAPPPLAVSYIDMILSASYQTSVVSRSGFYPLSITSRQSAADV